MNPDRIPEDATVAIGPKDEVFGEFIHVSGDELRSPGRVFVWGWIDYNDIFEGSPRHRTEFCFWLDQTDNREWVTRFYHLHNGYDEDCFKQPTPI